MKLRTGQGEQVGFDEWVAMNTAPKEATTHRLTAPPPLLHILDSLRHDLKTLLPHLNRFATKSICETVVDFRAWATGGSRFTGTQISPMGILDIQRRPTSAAVKGWPFPCGLFVDETGMLWESVRLLADTRLIYPKYPFHKACESVFVYEPWNETQLAQKVEKRHDSHPTVEVTVNGVNLDASQAPEWPYVPVSVRQWHRDEMWFYSREIFGHVYFNYDKFRESAELAWWTYDHSPRFVRETLFQQAHEAIQHGWPSLFPPAPGPR